MYFVLRPISLEVHSLFQLHLYWVIWELFQLWESLDSKQKNLLRLHHCLLLCRGSSQTSFCLLTVLQYAVNTGNFLRDEGTRLNTKWYKQFRVESFWGELLLKTRLNWSHYARIVSRHTDITWSDSQGHLKSRTISLDSSSSCLIAFAVSSKCFLAKW